MAQLQKVEGQIELNCHADKFYDVWARNTHKTCKIIPNKVTNVVLLEGDNWNTLGAVLDWKFVGPNGEHEFVKVKIEETDENSKTVTYKYLDGQLLNFYQTGTKSRIQVIPKGENCTVKWTFYYEKKTEDAPEANIYLDMLLEMAKDMDAHLCNN